MCLEEKLKPLELIKWIRTRWGSMYNLLDRSIATKAVRAICNFVDKLMITR